MLRVHAQHGYGSFDLEYRIYTTYIGFSIGSTQNWSIHAVNQHVKFGLYWLGTELDNTTTHPLVMGKLQGPLGLPLQFFGSVHTAGAPQAAGFVTISRNTYYNTIFGRNFAASTFTGSTSPISSANDIAFTVCASANVAKTWETIARDAGIFVDNPNRFASWYWGSSAFSEGTRAVDTSRALSLGADLLFLMGTLDVNTWDFDPIKYPSGINATMDYIRSKGLLVGLHTLPYPPMNLVHNSPAFVAETLLPEGLAPTYRSRNMWNANGSGNGHVPTEDLGFWWGHDKSGNVAQNGNPTRNWYGFECPQLVPGYACTRWGSNMSLVRTKWSTHGAFRSGGSIGFNETAGSYSEAAHIPLFEGLVSSGQLTLGMTVHLPPSTQPSGAAFQGSCLAHKQDTFKLGILANGSLHWSVQVQVLSYAMHPNIGPTNTTSQTIWFNTTSARPLLAGSMYMIKATFRNWTMKLFINNTVVAETAHSNPQSHNASLVMTNSSIIFGAATAGAAPAEGFTGSMEEVCLKNVSTDTRVAYLYADNVRAMSGSGRPDDSRGAYVFDFSRQSARSWYAAAMSHILNQGGGFDATQWDGSEINLLIAGWGIPHSKNTFNSGMYRSPPSPDWYHIGKGRFQANHCDLILTH